ncbi:MAG: neutral zinc metallopeptidase [Xanthobacteraceae bacterium]|nr:neutral zinc metallopeptidase [Xanthobacteraceae bacterium]QYK45531.1 MAG: neutral zinc metallopeptidase [Xanthobacteraceae bacterium]HMN51125.1 neutral zinc metallopeptidase [Xanthobacteraceae bacterium]
MRWDDFRQSDNVEDRRDDNGNILAGPGFPLPTGQGGLGIGTIIILGLLAWAIGIDPRVILGGIEMAQGPRQGYEQQVPNQPNIRKKGAPTDELGRFVAGVLGETEDRWSEIFAEGGQRYRAPRLVIFRNATRSACGYAQSAMGPFYCPPEQAVYLDTSFFQDLQRKLGACPAGSKTCEFSQAYVIAHEIGHHVQNLLGVLPKVQQAQRGVGQRERNALQVRVELQADCFAGVWANRQQKKRAFLDPGDVDAALQTASAIGDDMLQRRSQGYVVPDSFTHGSSAQRKRWFQTGFESGSLSACNTFSASSI